MAENPILEMISAFAAGCMDKANYLHFKDYLKKGGELPPGQLGEMQNVIALISILLEQEKPPFILKDQLAQKLIGLQDEIKTKIREEKRQSAASLIREKASGEETKEKTPQSDSEEKIKTQKVKPLHSEQHTRREKDEKAPASVQVEERKTSGKTSGAVWGSIALLFALVLYAIFGAPESTAELETDVADLKTRVRGLQNELANTNEFIGDHISLIEFINNKNIDIINFLSPEAEVNYWGRLFISFDAGEALLQVNSIPSLNQDEVYQVWLVTKDAAFSLGALFINPDENYYKISGIPYVPKEMISLFRITIEKAPSAETPLGKTFLYGVINNNALSPRK